MHYTLTKSRLSYVLEGTDQVLALRTKIDIDKKDITAIEWYDVFSDWSGMMVRMPGSYLPRWVMAGSYWTEDGWDFVFAKKPKGIVQPILHEVIVITTNKVRYKRVIIEATKENAQEIIAWWKESKRHTES